MLDFVDPCRGRVQTLIPATQCSPVVQDDCLATILRDYVPKGLALPGVRATEAAPWPPHSSSHRAPGISFHNGRVYIDYRRELMFKYAAKWMGSLHDHDRSAYADMICQLSHEISADSTFASGLESGVKDAAERLRCIIKLGQTCVIFTAFEEVFRKWLDFLPGDHRQVWRFFPPLSRCLTGYLVLSTAHPSFQQRRRIIWSWKCNARQLYPYLRRSWGSHGHRSLETPVPSRFRKRRGP